MKTPKTFREFLGLENIIEEKVDFRILVKDSDVQKATEALDAEEIWYEVGDKEEGKTIIRGRGKPDFMRIIAVVDDSGAEWGYPTDMEDSDFEGF